MIVKNDRKLKKYHLIGGNSYYITRKIADGKTSTDIIIRHEYINIKGEVYSIQHYVIKVVSDLWHVDGFLQVLRFPPPIKLTATL